MKVFTGLTAALILSVGSIAYAEQAELGKWMEANKQDSNACLNARKELEDAEDYLDNVSRPSSFELKMYSNAEEQVALHCNVASN